MIQVYKHQLSRKLIASLQVFLMVFSLLSVLIIPAGRAQARSLASTDYAAGASPYSVAVGDLNNDGLKDVAVTNFTGGTVGVYFQQSGGDLAPMTLLNNPPGAYNYGYFTPNPYAVKISDIDQDGLNDLIVSNEFQHQVWIYRQDSLGLYLYQMANTPPIETHPYSNPYSTDAGDLSGDGYPDVVIANYYWRDGGTDDYGSIGILNNWPAAANDLYSVSFVDSSAGWIAGNHSVFATLTGGWNSLSGASLWDAQLIPLDDSDNQSINTKIRGIDFTDAGHGVAVGDYGHIIFTDSGGREWLAAQNSVAGSLNAVSLADGNNGTAVGAGGLIVRSTDGGMSWTQSTTMAPSLYGVDHNGIQTWFVGAGGYIGSLSDYTKDAQWGLHASGTTADLKDISFADGRGWIVGDAGTILASNSSTAGISWSPQTSGVASNLNAVDFVDANNGWAVGDAGTVLHTSNGGTAWSTQTVPFGTPNLNGVSFVDVNNGWAVGDNGTVLHTSDGGATWSYQGNYGSRWFSSMYNYPLGSDAANPYVAKVGDINNDGKNDITVAAASGAMTNYRMGVGGGGLFLYRNEKQTVAVGVLPADMAFLDYNNDGRTDVAITNNQDQSVSILTQPILPTNGFDKSVTLDVQDQPLGIAAADLNGDGIQDLAVANSAADSISVFTKQSAAGQFNPGAVFNTKGSGPYGLAVGDVNNDGRNEVVVADSGPTGGNKIEVFTPTSRPGAPTVTSASHPDGSVYYNNNKPQFQISPPPDIDGVAGYYWKIDNTSNTVPSAADNWTADGSVSILTSLADGEYYFHAVAKDSQGNIGNTTSETANYQFKINSTPLIAAIQSPGDGGTVGGTVNIVATATTSPLFNITKMEFYIDTETVPAATLTGAPYQYAWDSSSVGDGSHTIKVVAYDSGNRQASDVNTVNVDNSAAGGSSSGVTRSSIELTGDQFSSGSGNVSGLTLFDAGSDTWSQVGYFAPGAAPSSAVYEFDPPAPSGYLWQNLEIKEDSAVASGQDARYYAYNWATGEWDSIAASGDLSFWFIQPGTNKVKVKVTAPAWSVHQIKTLTLSYKYQSDADAPQVTSINGSNVNFANPYFSRLSFALSEKAFLTIDIKDSASHLVREIKTAKSEGIPAIYWDLTDNFGNPVGPDNYSFQITATDIAGNTTVSALGSLLYRPTSVSPYLAKTLSGLNWHKIKSVSGDFNNDGRDDLAVLYDLGNNHTVLYQLNSNGSSFNLQTVWDSGAGNWSWGASTLAAGDFNGDNRDDVAILYGYGGARTRGFVALSNGTTLNAPTVWWDSGPGNWSMAGTKVKAGDFNKDGQDDLAMLYGYSGQRTRAFVAVSNGSSFSQPTAWWDSGPGNWNWGGSRMETGDFDNDGYSDIAVLYSYAGARTILWVFTTNGSGFHTPTAWWDSGPGNWDGHASKVNAGDYNNDGLSDLIISYGYSGVRTKSFGFISNGGAFNQPVDYWDSGPGNWDWSQSKFVSGDYNGDNLDDLAVFYNYGSFTGLWEENM